MYLKNKEWMADLYPELLEKLEGVNWEKEPAMDIQCFETGDGELGMYIQKEKGIVQLSSEYDDKRYAKIWWEDYNNLVYNSIIVLFGLGTGTYLKEVLQNIGEDNFVIIYEPSKQIFKMALEKVDFSNLFNEKVILLIEGLNADKFKDYLAAGINHSNLEDGKFCCIPNYNRLFKETYINFNKIIKTHMDDMVLQRNTRMRFATDNAINLIRNIKFLADSYSMSELMERLPSDAPAIIVSAGPSLEKNIHQLHEAKGKALIIATDTALKPLFKAGITPDLYVTIDALKPLVLFEDERIWDIPMCVSTSSNPDLIEKERGKILFHYSGDDVVKNIFQKFNKNYSALETGGSVACNAFSIAREAGMNPIILIGQDLAFTNNKSHANGTFQETMPENTEYDSNAYIPVEDINGNQVMTMYNLRAYKEWFERQIESSPQIRVIDATEGGAKIYGSEITPLKDVIARECTKEYDFDSIFTELPCVFEEEEKEQLQKYIREFPVRIEAVKKKAEKGIKYYEELMRHFKHKDFQSKAFKKVTEKIKKLNAYMEKNEEASMVIDYIRIWDYLITKDIRRVKGDIVEEGNEIAGKGIEELNFIIKGAEELAEEVRTELSRL